MIAGLEERKLILRAGVEELKKSATGTHKKTDAKILADFVIISFFIKLDLLSLWSFTTIINLPVILFLFSLNSFLIGGKVGLRSTRQVRSTSAM